MTLSAQPPAGGTAAESGADDAPQQEPDGAAAQREAPAGAVPDASAPAADASSSGGAAASDASEAPGGPSTDTDAAPAADEEATAAKSRFPLLVRRMTAAAAGGRPARAGAVGRPGAATLAGAAVAGALLVSVPLLLIGRGDGDQRVKTANAAPGAVLDGGDQHEVPGAFAPASPDPGDDGHGGRETHRQAGSGAAAPAKDQPDAGKPSAGDEDSSGPKKPPAHDEQSSGAETKVKKATGRSESGGGKPSGDGDHKKQPTKPKVTLGAPVSFRGHESGRCLDVPASRFHDGMALQIWHCNGSNAQRWRVASDGTIRIGGKCLDVANAEFHDGTTIQLAWCNGNIAQQFTLNERHDLVNTAVGMCVDVSAHHTNNGAMVQLWTCNGQDNQKWSFG